MFVERIMSRPVLTARTRDTLNVAAGIMWENDCGALPVIDDEGVVAGMITDRDICMAAYTTGRALHALRVADAMAKRVLHCLPTDNVHDVERLMATSQVRRVPVVDGHGKPIGIVSMNDIARYSAHEKTAAKEAMTTLAAICEPRRRQMPSA